MEPKFPVSRALRYAVAASGFRRRCRTFSVRDSAAIPKKTARHLHPESISHRSASSRELWVKNERFEPSLAPRCSFMCFRRLHSGRSVAEHGIAVLCQNF